MYFWNTNSLRPWTSLDTLTQSVTINNHANQTDLGQQTTALPASARAHQLTPKSVLQWLEKFAARAMTVPSTSRRTMITHQHLQMSPYQPPNLVGCSHATLFADHQAAVVLVPNPTLWRGWGASTPLVSSISAQLFRYSIQSNTNITIQLYTPYTMRIPDQWSSWPVVNKHTASTLSLFNLLGSRHSQLAPSPPASTRCMSHIEGSSLGVLTGYYIKIS